MDNGEIVAEGTSAELKREVQARTDENAGRDLESVA